MMAQNDMLRVESSLEAERYTGGGIIPWEATDSQPDFGNRKIITTYHLSAETKHFDAGVEHIRGVVDFLGGYIESSSVQGRSLHQWDSSARWAHFTVRIPANNINRFVALVGENYNVTSLSQNASDITDAYFDSEARLTALQAQERRLQALLEREGDLQYLLEVEREIANVRWQIESVSSSLQRMDSAVNFSTANISLQEVMEYNIIDPLPMSFGERLNQAWSGGWERFARNTQTSVTSFVWNLPYHIQNFLWFLFWVAVFLIVRRIVRKRKGMKKGEPTFRWMTLYKRTPKVESPREDDERCK